MDIKYLTGTALFLSLGMFTLKPVDYNSGDILGMQYGVYSDYAASTVQLSTKSSFAQKEIEEDETIDFPIQYEDDKNREYGEEEVIQKGKTGRKIYTYLMTYWQDSVISKDLVKTDTEEPTPEIVSVGKKVVWRNIETELGDLKYWRKMHVFATKYDGNCEGCRGLTYSGTLVRKGVCAVDPKVISLGTNFYVVGYGMCRSEDIGGLIKGNRIDLGYEDVTKGDWRTGWTDIYLLTSAPDD